MSFVSFPRLNILNQGLDGFIIHNIILVIILIFGVYYNLMTLHQQVLLPISGLPNVLALRSSLCVLRGVILEGCRETLVTSGVQYFRGVNSYSASSSWIYYAFLLESNSTPFSLLRHGSQHKPSFSGLTIGDVPEKLVNLMIGELHPREMTLINYSQEKGLLINNIN